MITVTPAVAASRVSLAIYVSSSGRQIISSFSIPRGFRASSVTLLSLAYFGPCTSCHGDTVKMYLVIIRIAVRQNELIGQPGI